MRAAERVVGAKRAAARRSCAARRSSIRRCGRRAGRGATSASGRSRPLIVEDVETEFCASSVVLDAAAPVDVRAPVWRNGRPPRSIRSVVGGTPRWRVPNQLRRAVSCRRSSNLGVLIPAVEDRERLVVQEAARVAQVELACACRHSGGRRRGRSSRRSRRSGRVACAEQRDVVVVGLGKAEGRRERPARAVARLRRAASPSLLLGATAATSSASTSVTACDRSCAAAVLSGSGYGTMTVSPDRR